MSGKYKPQYPRVAQLKTAEQFGQHLEKEGIQLGFDSELVSGDSSPFGKAHKLRSGRTIGNAMCILPMEGWDGTEDGRPTDLTKRRWKNFALSGAKLLWGCEAVAVRHEGRANPNQLLLNEDTFSEFVDLFDLVQSTHQEHFGETSDLVVGLQLTHSGRFCKPNDKKHMEPRILYPHPVLNKKFGLSEDYPLMTDEEIDNLIFLPGFSTAEQISDLSGRGVGMDVVRTAIEQVHGNIVLESTKGQGTRIRLSLPLSMAVTNVMTVESNQQMFGIPMDAVVETVRVPRASVRTIKQRKATLLRGRVVPLRDLNAVLGLAAPPVTNDSDEYAVLVVRVGDESLGLVVDDFHETADIILKPLSGVLSGLRAYSGSALMGDGSVLMVLNTKEML